MRSTEQTYPVRVGAMLFTMVDPVPGHEVAYNRWYERDHFYGGVMTGPYAFAGGRWVATRRHKALRFPEHSPFAEPVTAGSYLAVYWFLAGKVAEHLAWAGDQVWWLYRNGRGFDERTHAQTGIYDFSSARYATGDGVPVELALDHRYGGLAVVVIEPSGDGVELREWLDTEAAQLLLSPHVADQITSWTVRAQDAEPSSPMPLGAAGGRPDRIVQLVFLDDDPAGHWDAFRDYAKAIEDSGRGRVTFAAPFIPTVVGTDTYTDQLW